MCYNNRLRFAFFASTRVLFFVKLSLDVVRSHFAIFTSYLVSLCLLQGNRLFLSAMQIPANNERCSFGLPSAVRLL